MLGSQVTSCGHKTGHYGRCESDLTNTVIQTITAKVVSFGRLKKFKCVKLKNSNDHYGLWPVWAYFEVLCVCMDNPATPNPPPQSRRQPRDMCAYMWFIRAAHVLRWNRAQPWALTRWLKLSRVSLARFLSKHWLHSLLSERGCVPWGDDRGSHVGRGHFQSGESLYQRLRGGRSRKLGGGRGKKSCKYNTSAPNCTWSHWSVY